MLTRILVLILLGLSVGCGRAMPPRPPEDFAPVAVSSLQAARIGSTVQMSWRAPAKNQIGEELTEIAGYRILCRPYSDKPVGEAFQEIGVVSDSHLDAGGFSWWEIRGSKEQMRADTQNAAKILVEFVSQYIQRQKLSPSKTILVGFSQGGALISLLIQQSMLDVSGAALLASFAIKIPDVQFHCPVFIAHGSNDEVITLTQSESTRDHFMSCGAQVHHVVDEVGHKIGVNGMRELKSWINRVLEARFLPS